MVVVVLLDVALVLLLVVALVVGYRRGLVRGLGGLLGVLAGAAAGIALGPLVAGLVGNEPGGVVAVLFVAIGLVVLGHTLGSGIGSLLGARLLRGPLGVVDRVLGALLRLGVTALVASAVASTVAALGVPFLAEPVAASAVLRAVNAATPAPVGRAVAELRSVALTRTLPELGGALGGHRTPASVPGVATNRALEKAARSVVQVVGAAPACGQRQAGSGFVVAPGRVLTNAHVVAGVAAPVVRTVDGRARTGVVVRLDRSQDLALIAVRGLSTRALPVGLEPAPGTTGVIDGFPLGGPFSTSGARVEAVGRQRVPDIGRSGTHVRTVATLAADVQQGDSGGPLLDRSGRVVGVVFAKSATTERVGFAMTPAQFRGLVADAPRLTDPVGTGACERG